MSTQIGLASENVKSTGAAGSGGGGVQYTRNTTGIAATGTGNLVLGVNATTAVALAVNSAGYVFTTGAGGGVNTEYTDGTVVNATGVGILALGVSNNSARTILLHTTGGLIIASMPSVGGGVQYSIGGTDMGATGTGSIALAIQSGATTGRGLAVTTTGALYTAFITTQAVTAANVTVASITTGTVSIINTPVVTATVSVLPAVSGSVSVINTVNVSNTVNQQYVVDTTAMGATATGIVFLGMQSGATTARGIALTTTGAQLVSVQNILSASGVTIASVTTGTVNVVNVLSASGVTVANITTGTVNVVNVLSATGVLLAATTASVGAFVGTAHASRWNAFAVNTTSGSSTIVKTSGAHTLYVTSLLVSVNTQCRVDILSAATTLLSVYLGTFGGFALPVSAESPLVLNSNQSLTFTPSVSGSASCYAAGYTFT